MSLRLVVVLLGAITVALAGATPASAVSVGYVPASHRVMTQGVKPTPVPQSLAHAGQQGYRLAPASGMHLPASTSKMPFFRGGKRSSTTAAAPATTAGPRIPLPPGTPTLYNNLNQAGMNASGSAGTTPPDSTGAIGPNNYVEMDNSNIAVYTRSLGFVSTASLDAFIGQPPGVPLCDVQIQWDPAANRWLFAFLYCNTSTTQQLVVVGWSKTSDPSNLLANNTVNNGVSNAGTGGWCAFTFINDPFLLDFPKLGHNAGWLIVGGNLYDESNAPNSNPPFVSAGMEWTNLPANNSDTSCTVPATEGGNNQALLDGDGITPAFTPVPVNNDTNASDVYVISAYDPAGNTGGSPAPKSKLSTWWLDATGTLNAGNDLGVNSYQMPMSASQPGTTDTIDTLDGRLTQAVGDPTTGMYTQHTVLSAGGQSEVDWYEITASGGVATLVQQGTIVNTSIWTFNAAISPRFDGQGAAIFYNESSGSFAPIISSKIRRPSTAAGTFEAGSTTLASSSASVTDFSCNNPTLGSPCRWGDYSGATPDPVQTNVVWGTNEFNTASGSTPAWSDQNFAVYAAVRPFAPTSVMARSDGRGDAVVSWTPSSFDPGSPVTSFQIFAHVGATQVASMTVPNATVVQFRGLSQGVTYTFTVFAINAVGFSPSSPASNPVTIDGAVTQASPAPIPPARSPISGSAPPTPSPRPR